jgi:hypothetical protein
MEKLIAALLAIAIIIKIVGWPLLIILGILFIILVFLKVVLKDSNNSKRKW